MTSGERIKAAISHKTIDRIPMIEIGFWDETIKRFQEEGMPKDFYFQPSIWSGGEYRTENTVEDYLGLDRIAVLGYDCSIQLDTEIYDENEKFIIYRNNDGVTCKSFKNKTSVPHFVDNLIKNINDWNNYKERLKADWGRVLEGTEQCYKTTRAEGIYNAIKPEEGCQYALYLLGDERCLEYMALQPKMIEDITQPIPCGKSRCWNYLKEKATSLTQYGFFPTYAIKMECFFHLPFTESG